MGLESAAESSAFPVRPAPLLCHNSVKSRVKQGFSLDSSHLPTYYRAPHPPEGLVR
jgi:hypothetical protein